MHILQRDGWEGFGCMKGLETDAFDFFDQGSGFGVVAWEFILEAKRNSDRDKVKSRV